MVPADADHLLGLEPLDDLLAECLEVDAVADAEDWVAAHLVEPGQGCIERDYVAVDIRQHANETRQAAPPSVATA